MIVERFICQVCLYGARGTVPGQLCGQSVHGGFGFDSAAFEWECGAALAHTSSTSCPRLVSRCILYCCCCRVGRRWPPSLSSLTAPIRVRGCMCADEVIQRVGIDSCDTCSMLYCVQLYCTAVHCSIKIINAAECSGSTETISKFQHDSLRRISSYTTTIYLR